MSHVSYPCSFRSAEPSDAGLILWFIRQLAVYEHMEDEVVATEELIYKALFERHTAESMFVLAEEREVGFALFFHNFSTFLGRDGLYLEDLFVLPEYRGCGYGKALFRHVAKVAVERNCGRMEWSCLDWNKPGIDFYLSLGSRVMNEWTVYRLTGDTLTAVAGDEEK